jgi:CheY-like chemotaxis protein
LGDRKEALVWLLKKYFDRAVLDINMPKMKEVKLVRK